MAITLKQLCQYAKENYGMEIISGKQNMNQTVDWVHMLEDPETATFLHGHELIFTTGIGQRNNAWFVAFVKELMAHRASGLVLNLGPYIKEVPDDLKAFCEAHQFPLFTIPWQTRIVDITNDFCHRIMDAEKNEMTVAEAFRDILFFPEKTQMYRGILEQNAFELEADVVVFTMMGEKEDGERFINNESQIKNILLSMILEYCEHYSIFRQDKMLVTVLQHISKKALHQLVAQFSATLQLILPEMECHIGISESQTSVKSLAVLYKRAVAVMKMAQNQRVPYLSYEATGIYQLIIEIEDHSVLRGFYEQTLGMLEDYDLKNQTDLVALLKVYLDYNNSVEKVSKALYVHRNTINYKIKKIKEILQCELDYNDGVKMMLAFKIKDFIG